MRRLVQVAMALALLALMVGCGSSGSSSSSRNRPPPIERTVLLEVARKAQAEMRTQLHDSTVAVRGMQCRPASRVAYACSLGVVSGTKKARRGAVVVIYLKFDPVTNKGQMAFAASSNRQWARVLVKR
jgi:hypothetical protein